MKINVLKKRSTVQAQIMCVFIGGSFLSFAFLQKQKSVVLNL